MIEERIKKYIDEQLKEIRSFMEIYEDIPIIGAEIHTEVKGLTADMDKIKKLNNSHIENIKARQDRINKKLEELSKITDKK